jgi:cytochrome c oxidase cbb3-type subunit 3
MNANEPSLPEDAPADPLTSHNYDGIQEYDNPLPGWWKWLFVVTIAFAPPYFLYYHGGAVGRSLEDQYDQAYAAAMKKQFGALEGISIDRDSVVKFLYDEDWLRAGKAIFRTNCVSCHGQEGLGVVGPNLTDEEYKNIKDIGDFLTVIQNGANGGAMPAWTNRLLPVEIVLVSSYAASLRGSAAEGAGKAPEGRPIAPWPGPPSPEEEGDGGTQDAGTQDGGTQDQSDDSPKPESEETLTPEPVSESSETK